MKLRSLHIDQFGLLKDLSIDFGPGFTLITGPNESGKSTLHTALGALLFGMERGRGRAAKNDSYSAHLPWTNPEVYGGEISWEREDKSLVMQRDFARIPPQSRITLTDAGNMKQVQQEHVPFPEGLNPYLYVNTLSFRQPGAATGEGLAGELKNHVMNLHCSGDEDLDVPQALLRLKNRRRELEKLLDREAELKSRELKDKLAALEAQSLAKEGSGWDSLKEKAEALDAKISDLTKERSVLDQDLKKKSDTLMRLGISDRAQVEKDLNCAKELAEQLNTYSSSYGEVDAPRPKLLSFLSGILMLVVFGLFFLMSLLLQKQKYPLMAACFLAAVIAATFFTRLSRRADSSLGDKRNRKILSRLLGVYLPDYSPKGTSQEAEQLADYLGRVSELFAYLETKQQLLKERTEALLSLTAQRRSMDALLEQQLTSKLTKERWEKQVRDGEAALQELAPVLAENARLREEIAAVDLAVSTLTRLSEDVMDRFGAPLSREASRIFKEITGGAYQGLFVSDSLEIFALQNNRQISPSALSVGTMEQLYFAFRLAVIRLLWPEEPMPLFFDDSFVMYDSDRLEALLSWLSDQYRGQVILFSCQSREEDLLKKLGIEYSKYTLGE